MACYAGPTGMIGYDIIVNCSYQQHMHHANGKKHRQARHGITLQWCQPYNQAQIKENIKAPRHWPFAGNSPVTGEFPAQMASYAENFSIWWRRHGFPVPIPRKRTLNIWRPITFHDALNSLYDYFAARNRCVRQRLVITSHSLLWDVITYACPRYLLHHTLDSNIGIHVTFGRAT